MRRGTHPTLAQKKLISTVQLGSVFLNPKNWLVLKDNENGLYIMTKDTRRPFIGNPIKRAATTKGRAAKK